MEIWFYHLTRQSLDAALPTLLEKCLQRGWRAVVQATSETRLRALDDHLWTYADDSFLPHGAASEGDADTQAIYLTTGDENPNGARVRFLIEGARIEPLLDAEVKYERAIFMFDGADAAQLQDARDQWKSLRERGAHLAYWRQNDDGGWEQVKL